MDTNINKPSKVLKFKKEVLFISALVLVAYILFEIVFYIIIGFPVILSSVPAWEGIIESKNHRPLKTFIIRRVSWLTRRNYRLFYKRH